jgi:hypothetical protein
MNNVVKLLGICFFIGGCCTFSPTSKKCTCKDVYKEVEYHLKENVDSSQSFTKRYIKYNNSYPANEIFGKVQLLFIENKQCWLGEKKQLILDLLGKPDTDRNIKHGIWKKRLSYSYDVGLPPVPMFPKGRSQKLYINILYKKKLNEKISHIEIGKIPGTTIIFVE